VIIEVVQYHSGVGEQCEIVQLPGKAFVKQGKKSDTAHCPTKLQRQAIGMLLPILIFDVVKQSPVASDTIMIPGFVTGTANCVQSVLGVSIRKQARERG
jgi:hypothetical protein